MSWSIYTGQITDRLDPVFTEGHKPLLEKMNNNMSPMDLFLNAIQNGERKMLNNLLFINTDDYWVTISQDGKIEIGEGAA